jgi:hypothetical protein
MLVTELSYPPYRAPLTSLYNSLWYAGAIVYVVDLASRMQRPTHCSIVPLGPRTALHS